MFKSFTCGGYKMTYRDHCILLVSFYKRNQKKISRKLLNLACITE